MPTKKERKFSGMFHWLFAPTDAVSVLVIMGCVCCKQKKSAKAAAATSAAADVTDLSPSNLDGGLSTALNQGRYCPDPTQTIPDFNKGFSSSIIFPNTNTHQWSGGITSRTLRVCACMCECVCVNTPPNGFVIGLYLSFGMWISM